MRVFRYSLVVILCFGLLNVIGQAVHRAVVYAQPPASPLPQSPTEATDYAGINILLLIDQSGSMGGTRYRGDPSYGQGNDRYDLRFEGPAYALNWLARYQQTVVNNPPNIRFSLVSFGDQIRPLVTWQPLETSAADWADRELQLLEDISADRFGDINLGYTDFLSAFRRVRAIFENVPPTPLDEPYLNVIVLLTDGSPCVPTQADPFPNCQLLPPSLAHTHLAQVADLVRNHLPNTLLYVIALDDPDAYFPQLENDWESVVCASALGCSAVNLEHVKGSSEMGAQFNAVLADAFKWMGTANTTQRVNFPPGTFTVPPFTQFMRVSIFKSDTAPLGSGLTFQRPDMTIETQYSPSGVDSPIEIYEFQLPQSGEWTVNADGIDLNRVQGFIVATDMIVAGVQLEPDPPGSVTMLEPVRFTLQVVDKGGTLLEDTNPAWPELYVDLNFYDATNQVRADRTLAFQQELELDTFNAPGLYQYAEDIVFMQDGVYEVRAIAYYFDTAGQPRNLIIDEPVFDLLTVEQIAVSWNAPDPVSQRQGQPIRFSAALTKKVDGTPYAGGETLAFRVTPDGGTPQVLIDVAPAPGEVAVDFPLDQPGTHNLQVELGRVADDGSFVPLSTQDGSQQFSVTVRPVTVLNLALTTPQGAVSEVQAPFPRFWEQQPITLQAQLTDETGTPVSLSDLTNGIERIPTFTLLRDGMPYMPVTAPRVVSPGVYELTDALPAGNYVVTAQVNTPDSAFTGDYNLGNPSPALNHRRVNAFYFFPLLIGMAVLALVVVGGTAYIIYSRLQADIARRENPLRGSIAIYTSQDGIDGPSTRYLDLGQAKRNTVTFSASELPGDFKRLTITNYGEAKNIEDGIIYIIEYVYGKDKQDIRRPLMRGEYDELHVDTQKELAFQIGYDIGGLYSSVGGLEFNDGSDFYSSR